MQFPHRARRVSCLLVVLAVFVAGDATQASAEVSQRVAPTEALLPAKVGRYILRLMKQYDTNGDGVLQREEWAAMSGSPQAIDLDGDGTITLRELTYHVADYGLNFGKPRSIHATPEPAHRDPGAGFSVFRPISGPLPRGAAVPEAADEAAGALEGEGTATVDVADTATEELLRSGTLGHRRFHRPAADLAGVPAWFLMKDLDGDGQVTLIEYAPDLSSHLLAQFGALDRNGDGVISPDEARGR